MKHNSNRSYSSRNRIINSSETYAGLQSSKNSSADEINDVTENQIKNEKPFINDSQPSDNSEGQSLYSNEKNAESDEDMDQIDNSKQKKKKVQQLDQK